MMNSNFLARQAHLAYIIKFNQETVIIGNTEVLKASLLRLAFTLLFESGNRLIR